MLSSGMVQVLHDNPKLVKVCLKLLKEAANAVQSD